MKPSDVGVINTGPSNSDAQGKIEPFYVDYDALGDLLKSDLLALEERLRPLCKRAQ